MKLDNLRALTRIWRHIAQRNLLHRVIGAGVISTLLCYAPALTATSTIFNIRLLIFDYRDPNTELEKKRANLLIRRLQLELLNSHNGPNGLLNRTAFDATLADMQAGA